MKNATHKSGVQAVDTTGWDKWLRADHIKLHAGEMTAQELRTVQAVVRAMLAEARTTGVGGSDSETGEHKE